MERSFIATRQYMLTTEENCMLTAKEKDHTYR